MEVLANESLSKHTTIGIGGVAENYYFPESIEELISCMKLEDYRIIGGGSNLLIADHVFKNVVDTSKLDTSITRIEDGKYRVGASVRLQTLINSINKDGYGGIEYLYSVPGLVGGAVVMNAGRGRNFAKSIADYIESVEVVNDGNVQLIPHKECKFDYRNSIFKNSDMVIVAVNFNFPEMSVENSKQLKEERLRLCRETQDNSGRNFGSVFLKYNSWIIRFAKATGLKRGNVCFSKKTGNWLLSHDGKYEDARKCISTVEKIHKFLGQECIREVIIWE